MVGVPYAVAGVRGTHATATCPECGEVFEAATSKAATRKYASHFTRDHKETTMPNTKTPAQTPAKVEENTPAANRARIEAARKVEAESKKAETRAAPRVRVERKQVKSKAEEDRVRARMIAEGRTVKVEKDGTRTYVVGKLPNSGPKQETKVIDGAALITGRKSKVPAPKKTPKEKPAAKEKKASTSKSTATKTPATPNEKRNGFTRPRPGGKTAKVWDLADANPGKTRKEILAMCEKKGYNMNMAQTQYGRWRRFMGL
jgi:hypothetical protein